MCLCLCFLEDSGEWYLDREGTGLLCLLLGELDLRLCLLRGGEGEYLPCRRGEEYLPLELDGDRESLFLREEREDVETGECRRIRGGLGGLRTLELRLREGGERLFDLKFKSKLLLIRVFHLEQLQNIAHVYIKIYLFTKIKK